MTLQQKTLFSRVGKTNCQGPTLQSETLMTKVWISDCIYRPYLHENLPRGSTPETSAVSGACSWFTTLLSTQHEGWTSWSMLFIFKTTYSSSNATHIARLPAEYRGVREQPPEICWQKRSVLLLWETSFTLGESQVIRFCILLSFFCKLHGVEWKRRKNTKWSGSFVQFLFHLDASSQEGELTLRGTILI